MHLDVENLYMAVETRIWGVSGGVLRTAPPPLLVMKHSARSVCAAAVLGVAVSCARLAGAQDNEDGAFIASLGPYTCTTCPAVRCAARRARRGASGVV